MKLLRSQEVNYMALADFEAECVDRYADVRHSHVLQALHFLEDVGDCIVLGTLVTAA